MGSRWVQDLNPSRTINSTTNNAAINDKVKTGEIGKWKSSWNSTYILGSKQLFGIFKVIVE